LALAPIDLGTLPGGDRSAASNINYVGHIVGSSQTSSGDSQAFLWEKGKMTDLGTLAHATLARYAQGKDVALEAAALKLSALDGGIRCMIDAIQSCGAYGLQDDAFFYPMLLDAVSTSIGGGTEEAQRAAIFNEMVRRHARANRHG
jgi:probable HAF family extracellular repeat protein